MMEATIIPLRLSLKPSPQNISGEKGFQTQHNAPFDTSNIEILLNKSQLLTTKIPLDVEPASVICSFLQSISPPSSIFKGKRSVCVPISEEDKQALYCVPLDFEGDAVDGYGFIPINEWFKGPQGSSHASRRVESWLKKQLPQSLQLLFCTFADDRFKWSIVNPGFPDEQFSFPFEHASTQSPSTSSSSSSSSRLQKLCQEKVLLLDRIDIVKSNPLFGSHLSFKYKVDRLVTNWGWGGNNDETITNLSPKLNNFHLLNNNNNNNHDMNTIVSSNDYNINNNNNNNNTNNFYKFDEYNNGRVEKDDDDDFDDDFKNSYANSMQLNKPSFISNSARRKFHKKSYPLHQHVLSNNMEGVLKCIRQGISPLDQDDYFDTPLHLAAEKGHLELVKVMLDEADMSIDSTNYHNQSLLHVACINNLPLMVDFLLNRGIKTSLKDKNHMTALQHCDNAPECAKILRRYMQQPLATIDIHLMDCSHRQLILPSNADTTVEQLHRLMMKELQLPDECMHLFSIWICSRNLQLQLKKDQKPIQQLNDWKSKIVAQMTDHPPELEDPELYWRRDVLLSIKLETLVTNQVAIGLLFAEAYNNFIKSFYLASEQDVVIFASFIMQLFFGNFKSNVDYFEKKGVLESLVPAHQLPKDSRKNWCKKILTQYQTYSSKLTKNISTVHHVYFLMKCRQLITYGCAFFIGIGKYKNKTKQIFVGVNDVGCQIIETLPRQLTQSFNYSETDWKLVTSESRKELVLRKRSKKKNEYVIISKQTGLMDNLMRRLSNLSDPK